MSNRSNDPAALLQPILPMALVIVAVILHCYGIHLGFPLTGDLDSMGASYLVNALSALSSLHHLAIVGLCHSRQFSHHDIYKVTQYWLGMSIYIPSILGSNFLRFALSMVFCSAACFLGFIVCWPSTPSSCFHTLQNLRLLSLLPKSPTHLIRHLQPSVL